MTFHIVQGDLEPDMEIECAVNSAAKDLTTADGAQLRWKRPDGSVVMVDLEVSDPVAGVVKRVWAAGDTDQVGVHEGQVVVTWPTGETQTFPSTRRYARWIVEPQLEDTSTP